VFLGTETVHVVAPTEGETVSFEVPFAQGASAYRYELLS
jgi:hypothetical protein